MNTMIFSDSTIAARKQKTAEVLARVLKNDEVLLVHAGAPIQKPGGHDQTYPFLPHPDYFWLTGSRRPNGVSVFSLQDGWIDFVQPITREEKIWEGGGHVISGRDIKDLPHYIANRKTHHMGQTSSPLASLEIQEAFLEVRRVKDAAEIALVIDVANIANRGYQKLKSFIRPGISERDIQIEYETEVLKAGSEKFPYECIVGTGTNAAILHAIPTKRVVKSGEMVLIDAGADVADYCVDITRVFAANGSFSTQQKAIYDIVHLAQEKSIALCKPGVEWHEVHLASAEVMAKGLSDLGILNCNVPTALESGVVSVFFPHGVGHMVGLRVRDVGGKPNPHPKKYAGARLRVDMPLRDGYLMTVEPGLYFIEALLKDSETRSTYKDLINWNEVEKWLDVGGVRLEDDIHVTAKGPVNLTHMVEK